MAVPDDFESCCWGLHRIHVHKIFQLAPLGNPVFSGNVDHFFEPKIRQLHSSGGVSTLKNFFFLAVLRSHTKSSQCADLVLRSHTKSSQCADLKYLRSASECPVCDLVLCDLVIE